MGLSKKKQYEIAKSYGIALADSMFKDFQDPKMRGENFKWENYPALAGRFAKVGCFMSFPHKISEEIKEYSEAVAICRAKELLITMEAFGRLTERQGSSLEN